MTATEELRVPHLHTLLEFTSKKVDVSFVLVYLEYDYPGALQVSAIFAYLEISGEPTGAEIHGAVVEGTHTPEGMGEPLFGDRSAWDVVDYPERHARDIDEGTWEFHKNPSAPSGEGISILEVQVFT
jgi:hypothetical protein